MNNRKTTVAVAGGGAHHLQLDAAVEAPAEAPDGATVEAPAGAPGSRRLINTHKHPQATRGQEQKLQPTRTRI